MTKWINTYSNLAAYSADTANFSFPHTAYAAQENTVKYDADPSKFYNIWGTATGDTVSLSFGNNTVPLNVNGGYFFYNFNGSLTSAFEMFKGNRNDNASITSINISGINASNLDTMYHMFSKLPNLVELNANNFTTTSALTSVQAMFQGCSSLTSVPDDFKNIDCSNVTSIQTVFDGCSSLTEADLSGWINVNKGGNLIWFFRNCTSLTTINISGWDTSNMALPNDVTPPTYGCSSLRNIIMNNTNQGTLEYWQTSLYNSGIAGNVTITRDGYNWTYSGGQWNSTPI